MAGVGALLFAAVCFGITAVCIVVVFVCAQIWLVATISLHFKEGAYLRATLWSVVLSALLTFDIALLTAIA